MIRVPLLTCGLLTLFAWAGCSDPPEAPRIAADVLDVLGARALIPGRVDLGPQVSPAVGTGWHAPEPVGRWTAERDAELTLPRVSATARVLRIRAGVLDAGPPTKRMHAFVNGFALEPLAIGRALQEYEVAVPPSALVPGDNRVTLTCDALHTLGDDDERALGLFVDWVRLEEEAPPPQAPAPPQGLAIGTRDWIELGEIAAVPGALEIEWAAPDSLTPGDGVRLELAAANRDVWTLESLLSLELLGGEGAAHITLDPDALQGRPAYLRLRADDPNTRIRVRDARHWLRERDDILLLVVDTLRADALACYGAKNVETPRIDALAARGVVFTHAYTHSPTTGPSHAALFTGRGPRDAGVVNNHEGRIDPKDPTLAEILRLHGYATQGVISIDPLRSRFGFARGFDSWDEDLGPGFLRRGDDTLDALWRNWAPEGGPHAGTFRFVHLAEPHEPYDAYGTVSVEVELRWNGQPVATVDAAQFEPGALKVELQAGLNVLDIVAPAPIQLRRLTLRTENGRRLEPVRALPKKIEPGTYRVEWLAPGAGPAEFDYAVNDGIPTKYELLRRYALEVSATDALVGQVVDAVARGPRADRTWIVLLSDHGEGLGQHGVVGHVETLYEEAVHVPWILVPPAGRRVRGPSRRDGVVALQDVMPTLLEAVGIASPEGVVGESRLRGTNRSDTALAETHEPQASETLFALRTYSHRGIWSPSRDAFELYDLRKDPGELTDLSHVELDLARKMRERLEERVIATSAGLVRDAAPQDEDTLDALKSLGYIE